MRWEFVCTANIARSPYAERRMAQLLGERSPIEVASAGVPGFDGRSMDEPMAAQLASRGCDGSSHSSRVLTEEILRGADLVLTMQFSHHMAILEKWPWSADRVRGLGQFAKSVAKLDLQGASSVEDRLAAALKASGRNSMAWDVADPHRRGRRAAKKAAEEIDKHLNALLPLVE